MLSRLHPNIALMVVALVAIAITAMLAAHQNPSEQVIDETKTYSSAQDFEVYRYMSQFDQDYSQTHFEWSASFNGIVKPLSWARFAILAADAERIRSSEGLAPGDNQGEIWLYLYNPQNFGHFYTDNSCRYAVTDYQTFAAHISHRHSFDDFQNLSRQVNAGRLADELRDRLLEAGFSRQIEIVTPSISCALLVP